MLGSGLLICSELGGEAQRSREDTVCENPCAVLSSSAIGDASLGPNQQTTPRVSLGGALNLLDSVPIGLVTQSSPSCWRNLRFLLHVRKTQSNEIMVMRSDTRDETNVCCF